MFLLVLTVVDGCGDGSAFVAVDAPGDDAVAPDAVAPDALVDASAATVDADVDAGGLDPHVDPSFGVGGSYAITGHGSAAAIARTAAGDVLLCGPSSLTMLVTATTPWVARVDGAGAAPPTLWTLAPAPAFERCQDVIELADGRIAVATSSRVQVRTSDGAVVAERMAPASGPIAALAAAPDGGLWVLDTTGLSRWDAALQDVPAFGVGGRVAIVGGADLTVAGADLATARVTVAVDAACELRRYRGDTGAADASFGVDGVADLVPFLGAPYLECRARQLVALSTGRVAVHTYALGSGVADAGALVVSADGASGQLVSGGLVVPASMTEDPTGQPVWPSWSGGAGQLDRLPVSNGARTLWVKPPGCGPCNYVATGAVWVGGAIVGYTMLESGAADPYSVGLVRVRW